MRTVLIAELIHYRDGLFTRVKLHEEVGSIMRYISTVFHVLIMQFADLTVEYLKLEVSQPLAIILHCLFTCEHLKRSRVTKAWLQIKRNPRQKNRPERVA